MFRHIQSSPQFKKVNKLQASVLTHRMGHWFPEQSNSSAVSHDWHHVYVTVYSTDSSLTNKESN